MALIYRNIAGANRLTKTAFGNLFATQTRCVVMRVSQAKPPTAESYEEKNSRLKRPLSPHLLIYKPQLTSMLSITHRMTGLALATYAVAFAAVSVCPQDFPAIAQSIQNWHLPASVIFSTKLILSYPVAFHLCNGIRHLVWDLGKALTIKEVYTTGYVMVAVSTVLAVAFASL